MSGIFIQAYLNVLNVVLFHWLNAITPPMDVTNDLLCLVLINDYVAFI